MIYPTERQALKHAIHTSVRICHILYITSRDIAHSVAVLQSIQFGCDIKDDRIKAKHQEQREKETPKGLWASCM